MQSNEAFVKTPKRREKQTPSVPADSKRSLRKPNTRQTLYAPGKAGSEIPLELH